MQMASSANNLNMEGVPIRFGKNRNRANAEFLAGANNAERDLSPVGDKNLVEHVLNGCGADTPVRFIDLLFS